MSGSGEPWAIAGFSGSGKSTVAPLVAALAGRTCIDLDARIGEARIAELLSPADVAARSEGEAALRREEARHLGELAGLPGIVVALGGGVLEGAASRTILGAHFSTVWLDVALEECLLRCALDRRRRPILEAARDAGELEALHARRRRLAQALRAVNGAGTADEVARRVHRMLDEAP